MEIFIGIILILIAHFVADFIFQPHFIAVSKSYNIKHLIYHIIIYALAFFIIFGLSWYFMFYIIGFTITAEVWLQMAFGITIVNSVLHYIIDYFTSNISGYFWKKQDYHNFFVIIGFDQLLHISLLIISYAEMLHNFNYI